MVSASTRLSKKEPKPAFLCPLTQDIHRVRERLIGNRTALANQIRGLLAEYGIVVAQGLWRLRQQLPLILEDA
jgi:transposase